MDLTDRREMRQKRSRPWRFFKGYVLPIAIGICVAFLVEKFIFGFSYVVSGSMVPTLPYPTLLLVDRVATEVHEPYRGEVIMFKAPPNTTPESPLLKRIIGMPGDTVYINDNHVYINGKVLAEPYLHVDTIGTFGPYHVPVGEYFVMGDNRQNSFDSRYWQNHFVPRSDIEGRIDAVLFPFHDFHIVR